ncbi:MAG: nuclear transport factor 2 family protein [Mycobacterium sp.]
MTLDRNEVQLLLDERDIRRVLDLYPRAIDRHDHELLASLFHHDAITEYGSYNGPVAGFIEFMRSGEKPGQHWMHHNGTQLVELHGNAAHAETYCLAFCRQNDESGRRSNQEVVLRVRYLDHLQKRGGRWRIQHRRVAFSPSHILEIAREFPLWEDTFVEGGAADPSYTW